MESVLGSVFAVCKSIYEKAKQAKCNEKVAQFLSMRVASIEAALTHAHKTTPNDFTTGPKINGLNVLMVVLHATEDFLRELMTMSAIASFLKSGSIQEQLVELDQRLTACQIDLLLPCTGEATEKVSELLDMHQKSGKEVMEALGGLAVQQEEMTKKIEQLKSTSPSAAPKWQLNFKELVFEKDDDGERIVLGGGGFAKVYAGEFRGDHTHKLAIKVCDDGVQAFVANFKSEVSISTRLSHPNVIRCFGATMPDFSNLRDRTKFTIVFERGDYTLRRAIAAAASGAMNFLPDERMAACRDVIAGLLYMHSSRPAIVHRDVKPENVLYVQEHNLWKLIDFGLSKTKASTLSHSKQSSAPWGKGSNAGGYTLYAAAPEVLIGDCIDDLSQDIYSFGILALETLTGRPPWDPSTDVYHAVVDLHQTPAIPTALLPTAMRDLIGRCLSYDRRGRPTTSAVFAAFFFSPSVEMMKADIKPLNTNEVEPQKETIPQLKPGEMAKLQSVPPQMDNGEGTGTKPWTVPPRVETKRGGPAAPVFPQISEDTPAIRVDPTPQQPDVCREETRGAHTVRPTQQDPHVPQSPPVAEQLLSGEKHSDTTLASPSRDRGQSSTQLEPKSPPKNNTPCCTLRLVVLLSVVTLILGGVGAGVGIVFSKSTTTAPVHWITDEPTYSLPVVYVSRYADIYALNGTTGTLMWNYTVESGAMSASVMNVVNGVMYAVSGSKIYALNATAGTLIWKYTTESNMFQFSLSPVVVKGVLYVAVDKIYALNATTGTLMWNYTRLLGFFTYPASTVVNGVLYFASGEEIYALNATTGTLLWNYRAGNWAMSVSVVNVAHGMLYGLYASKIFALNATAGNLIWNYTGENYMSSSPTATVVKGVVYAIFDRIYALNATTGTLMWNYTTLLSGFRSPTVVNAVLYCPWGDDIYVVNATTGIFMWNYRVGNLALYVSVVDVVNGVLYFRYGSKIGALNSSVGTSIWNYTGENYMSSSPTATVVKGVVYAMFDRIYALNATTGTLMWNSTTGVDSMSSSQMVVSLLALSLAPL